MRNWTLIRAIDFIDFNPTESLPKGAMAKKIAMQRLRPFARNISGYEIARFNGGSKFRNGDTLMARITPCLENGKTAQVNILEDGEVGFGSTEFIVLRAKPGISDKDFIYYLAISSILRERAIKSMSGATGRQRVQQDFANDIEFYAPPLPIQKQIVKKLDAVLGKIAKAEALIKENIKNIQNLFSSVLSETFDMGADGQDRTNNSLNVDFKNWERKRLGEACKIINGGTPKTNVKDYWNGDILFMTPKDLGKISTMFADATERTISIKGLNNSSAKMIPKNSVILSTRAPIGYVVITSKEMCFNQGCRGIIASKQLDIQFLYYFLKSNKKLLNDLGTGTTFKELSTVALCNINIPLPPLAAQKQIVQKLDAAFEKISKLKSLYEDKLNKVIDLRKSILQREFEN